jgi:hypothetical protein
MINFFALQSGIAHQGTRANLASNFHGLTATSELGSNPGFLGASEEPRDSKNNQIFSIARMELAGALQI